MGQKNRKKKEGKEKKILTKEERQSIISKIQVNALLTDMDDQKNTLWDLLKKHGVDEIFNHYVDNGGQVDKEIPCSEMGRVIIIRLYDTVTPRPLVNFHVI